MGMSDVDKEIGLFFICRYCKNTYTVTFSMCSVTWKYIQENVGKDIGDLCSACKGLIPCDFEE